MEAVTARRKDIEHHLTLDDTKLQELSDSLAHSEKLTTDMVDILESFQGRLNKMDKNIMPVYQKTKQLTQLQENVDLTLSKLQQVIGFHHIADEVDPKLKDGPTGNVEGYMKLLDKLRVAVDFFRYNNPSSMELSHVNTSFDRGIELLEKEFRDLLRRHSMPTPYTLLQQLLEEPHPLPAIDESPFRHGGSNVSGSPTIQHLPDEVVKDLSSIARYVVSSGDNRTDILSGYAQMRSQTLGRTLKSFSEAIQPSKQSSFAPFAVKPSPTKKQGGKKKDMSSGARGKIVQGKLSTSSLLAGEASSSSDEQLEGATVIIKLSAVLAKLMQTEWALMERVVPTRHHGYVFGILVSEPINYLLYKGDAVAQLASRQITQQHEYITIISLLRIIEQIFKTLPEYRNLLFNTNTSDELYKSIPNLMGKYERLAFKGMQDYVAYIRGDPEKTSNLPRDGTVHELTSKTMWFLEQMLEFSETAGRLCMTQDKDYDRDFDVEDCRRAVGNYIVQTLDALTLNMEQKSRSYESPVLAAVFLLNNFYFVQSAFSRKDEMIELMKLTLRDVEDNYDLKIENERKAYQRGFSKLLGNVGHLNLNNPPSKSQKQLLKDRFKGFNVELEDLYRTQQHYSIPDATLRRRVREEIVDLVIRPYRTFYEDYSTVNFTKNPDKYIKFSPDEVETKLMLFFDQGAR